MPNQPPFLRSPPQDHAVGPRAVLIVDDSAAQRKVLALQLSRWGYTVTEADSGQAALALCRARRFDIILSDWMMPEMDGVRFCRAFRKLPQDSYGYFILLTSKTEKSAIADGLESGADDFLSKPVNSEEFRARLRAGERILRMQDELFEKNRLILSTLNELQSLYDSLDRDLIEAKKLQQTLMRDRLRQYGAASVTLMLHPSGHVGGDLAGSFEIDSTRIGLYSVDVSGHGVASAMMTARLSGLLSGNSPEQNIALKQRGGGAWPPAELAARLNRLMLLDLQVDQYFTLAYAEVNLATGDGVLVQAGHPHPLILRANGAVESLGDGGMPIGLIEETVYEETHFSLRHGDRLFLVSDGITECANPDGHEMGQAGLEDILKKNRPLPSADLLESIVWHLRDFSREAEFGDDISALCLDFLLPP